MCNDFIVNKKAPSGAFFIRADVDLWVAGIERKTKIILLELCVGGGE